MILIIIISSSFDLAMFRNCIESKLLTSLGIVLFHALDYGLCDDEERALSKPLELLIESLTTAHERAIEFYRKRMLRHRKRFRTTKKSNNLINRESIVLDVDCINRNQDQLNSIGSFCSSSGHHDDGESNIVEDQTTEEDDEEDDDIEIVDVDVYDEADFDEIDREDFDIDDGIDEYDGEINADDEGIERDCDHRYSETFIYNNNGVEVDVDVDVEDDDDDDDRQTKINKKIVGFHPTKERNHSLRNKSNTVAVSTNNYHQDYHRKNSSFRLLSFDQIMQVL